MTVQSLVRGLIRIALAIAFSLIILFSSKSAVDAQQYIYLLMISWFLLFFPVEWLFGRQEYLWNSFFFFGERHQDAEDYPNLIKCMRGLGWIFLVGCAIHTLV